MNLVFSWSSMHWDDKNAQFVMSKVSKITHNVFCKNVENHAIFVEGFWPEFNARGRIIKYSLSVNNTLSSNPFSFVKIGFHSSPCFWSSERYIICQSYIAELCLLIFVNTTQFLLWSFCDVCLYNVGGKLWITET